MKNMIKQLLLIMGICIYSVNYCAEEAPAIPERSHVEQSTISTELPVDSDTIQPEQRENKSKESSFCHCCSIQ